MMRLRGRAVTRLLGKARAFVTPRNRATAHLRNLAFDRAPDLRPIRVRPRSPFAARKRTARASLAEGVPPAGGSPRQPAARAFEAGAERSDLARHIRR